MTKYRVFIRGFEDFHSKTLPKPSMFIAHDFTGKGKAEDSADIPRQIEDYRYAYEKGLKKVGYIPIYAPIYSGTILETLCEEMINTNAGIFDVSFGRQYNANVMIELGISLGINHPTIVVADEKHKPILDFLAPLNPLYYRDLYDLRDKIGMTVKERIEAFQKAINFCVICNQPHCGCRKELFPHDKHYSLVGLDDFPHIQIDVEDAVEHFKLEKMTLESDGHHTQLCTWLYHLRKSRFTLFYSQELGKRHHGAENAMTMVQLGMAIGAGVPWRIILKEGEAPPTDTMGYIHVQITSSTRSNIAHLKGAISFLKGLARPFAGHGGILETPDYLDEKESLNINVPIFLTSDELFNRTIIHLQNNQLDDAIESLEKAIQFCEVPTLKEKWQYDLNWLKQHNNKDFTIVDELIKELKRLQSIFGDMYIIQIFHKVGIPQVAIEKFIMMVWS